MNEEKVIEIVDKIIELRKLYNQCVDELEEVSEIRVINIDFGFQMSKGIDELARILNVGDTKKELHDDEYDSEFFTYKGRTFYQLHEREEEEDDK